MAEGLERLITNFDASELPIMEQLAKEWGNTLYIDDKAYNIYGKRLNGMYALKTKFPLSSVPILERYNTILAKSKKGDQKTLSI